MRVFSATLDQDAVPAGRHSMEWHTERERRKIAERSAGLATDRLHRELKTMELARTISEIAYSAASLADASQAMLAAVFSATHWRMGFVWRALDDGRWERFGAERSQGDVTAEIEFALQNQLPDYLTRMRGGQRTAIFEAASERSTTNRPARAVSAAVMSGTNGIDGYVELWSHGPDPAAESGFDILRHLALQLGHLVRREQSTDWREHLHERDALTGLFNRAGLVAALGATLDATTIGNRMIRALVVADIVDFAACNEVVGQEAADRSLIEVGRRLAAEVAPEFPLARISANAFAFPIVADREALLDDRDLSLASGNLLAAASVAFGVDRGVVGRFEFRTGIARCESGIHPSTLLARAETALRIAKKDGVRSGIFEPAMTQRASRAAQLRFALTHALQREEFLVVHQPLVNLDDGQVVGAETLLRWHSAEHGPVPCVEVVPMLEESGQILEVGLWVLEQSLSTAVQMRALTHGKWLQSVNVSAMQFQDRGFAQAVAQALTRHAYPGSALEIEITESVLLQPSPRVRETLRDLSALGIRIALDDFGTGYSAMSYLRTFDVDRLKIDRSFVTAQGSDARADRLIACIVAMGHALSMDVIGEGVETAEDRALLRRNGCPLGQGFGLAKPMTALALFDLVRSGARLFPG